MVCNTGSFQRQDDGRCIRTPLKLKCALGPHVIHNHRGLNEKEVARARLEFRCRIQMAGCRDWTKGRAVVKREYAKTPIPGWDANRLFAQMEGGMITSAHYGRLYFFGAKLGYSAKERKEARQSLRILKRAKRYAHVSPTALRESRWRKGDAAPAA